MIMVRNDKSENYHMIIKQNLSNIEKKRQHIYIKRKRKSQEMNEGSATNTTVYDDL